MPFFLFDPSTARAPCVGRGLRRLHAYDLGHRARQVGGDRRHRAARDAILRGLGPHVYAKGIPTLERLLPSLGAWLPLTSPTFEPALCVGRRAHSRAARLQVGPALVPPRHRCRRPLLPAPASGSDRSCSHRDAGGSGDGDRMSEPPVALRVLECTASTESRQCREPPVPSCLHVRWLGW